MVPFNVLDYYYKWGYSVIRKHTASAYVIICQRIGGDFIEFVNTLPADNVVLDVHFYNLFNADLFGKTTAQWNIDFINNDRLSLLQKLNTAGNALIFVGEFHVPKLHLVISCIPYVFVNVCRYRILMRSTKLNNLKS